MSVDARTKLGTLQAELVEALAGGGATPVGFDEERVHVAAAALANKRLRGVARAWSSLQAALGDRFEDRFAAFAATASVPRFGGPLADGRAFAQWLARSRALPDAARLQMLAVDVRYVRSAHGLRPRRGPTLKATLLHGPRRLVLAMRLPWLGERRLTIRVGRY